MKSKYMKWLKRTLIISISLILIVVAVFSRAIPSAMEFGNWPEYKTGTALIYPLPVYDSNRKTILVIADNDGTEMFDMLAPFYLFSATEKANVFVVAEKQAPIIVRKGLFVLPQFTFAQIDSMKITIDVMVVPNQSVMMGMKQKKTTIDFIRKHFTGTNHILSVCDGAATVAATGLYDGKPLTTHSSDYESVKKQFGKPAWERGVSVTESGNLFSTAGVSNATEGSLVVIGKLFGAETTQKVMAEIHYPHTMIKREHENLEVQANEIFVAVRKGAFKSNEKVGVVLQDSINELELAGVLDTYTRSFPSKLETFLISGTSIVSKYGLTMLPTGDICKQEVTEVHVLQPAKFTKSDESYFPSAKLITYAADKIRYIIDICLQRIESLYGSEFMHTVKLMLDYN